ncbi:MAG: Triosephosphate isomerase [Gammaproteobacteria bacterium]|nr:Triosephosphate isomerase [Gammaproteobacteria bacterium]
MDEGLDVRRALVAGNWKMNGTRVSVGALMEGILRQAGDLRDIEIAVFPPFVYLGMVADLVRHTPVVLGGQDLSDHDSGAYTGEIGAGMLRDVGCRYVIVGHSERRQYHGESDELVARKFARALEHGLVPILCVGETLAEREAGETEAVAGRQLGAVLATSTAAAFQQAVIAYEPVWAIGTGRNATPEQAQAVHVFIRGQVGLRDPVAARAVRILYGGSVKGGNAAALLAQPDIDGGLVGGASLDAAEFLTICRAAATRIGAAQG